MTCLERVVVPVELVVDCDCDCDCGGAPIMLFSAIIHSSSIVVGPSNE